MLNVWSQSILDELQEMVYLIECDTFRLLKVNKKIKQRFPEYKPGMKCHSLFYGQDTPCSQCGVVESMKGKTVHCQRMLQIDGKVQWIDVSYTSCQNQNNQNLCICTASDLPDMKELYQTAYDVLNGIEAATYVINPETYQLTFVNQYLKKFSPNAIPGALCYQALRERSSPCEECLVPFLGKNGDSLHRKVYLEEQDRYFSVDVVCLERGGHKNIVFTGYDITDSINNEKQLHKLAFLDLSLNMKNEAAFVRDMEQRLQEKKQYFVCMCKLKNFYNYNLILGRKAGDDFLRNLVEHYDAIYPKDKVYRVGGAKFVLVADTKEEYEALQYVMQHPFPDEVYYTHSGLHPYIDFAEIQVPTFAEKSEQIIHNLEYLLLRNQTREKNNILKFTQSDIIRIERRNRLISVLEKPPEKTGFCVYYQPIFSIEDEKFSKCEALLRLYDEQLGWVSPAEFIPIAEESRTINQLGWFVLEEVCRMLEWRKHQKMPSLKVNVNVSAVQFYAEGFFEKMKEMVSQYDIERNNLHMEITESIMVNSFGHIIELMQKIIDFGIDFSLDDFGTGYSNLSYLGALPLSEIKLDKSFVDNVVQSDIYVLIVNNVIKFAKELNLKIVAEGVENQEQYEILKRLGSDYIQGYLFSKPLAEKELFEFLVKNNRLEFAL